MESVQCPSCQQRFDDVVLLSLHHEYEPCSAASTAASSSSRGEFSCPVCNQSFDQPEILQIHFEQVHDSPSAQTTASDSLYAQDLARRERMKNEHEQQRLAESAAFNEDSLEDDDTRIARMLQEEEDAQSFAEFQNRYGGSTRTFSERAQWNLDKIFQKKFISQGQYEEYKRNLDHMIAQPTERVESRTSGLIPELARLPMGNVMDRRLCRPGCDHVKATWLDQGWACGYKNFQMLLSSLRHDPLYSAHLFGSDALQQEIPSVSYLQKLIEKAWVAGFDSDGREQLNGRLSNSTKWIGPTEIMACLANLDIKTELYDFHQPKTLGKTTAYAYLFKWVQKYFQQRGTNMIHPLYLQHEGHSRTIVGYEQFRDGNIRLLIFDPSTSKNEIENFTRNPNSKAHIFRRSLGAFQKPVYQILVVRGLLDPSEREAAKQVRSIKVPAPDS